MERRRGGEAGRRVWSRYLRLVTEVVFALEALSSWIGWSIDRLSRPRLKYFMCRHPHGSVDSSTPRQPGRPGLERSVVATASSKHAEAMSPSTAPAAMPRSTASPPRTTLRLLRSASVKKAENKTDEEEIEPTRPRAAPVEVCRTDGERKRRSLLPADNEVPDV